MDKKLLPNVLLFLKMKMTIHLDGIIDFNKNLGENGEWGHYVEPFEANQFTDIKFNDKSILIPVFGRSNEIDIEIKPKFNNKHEEDERKFSIDYIRLNLISPSHFETSTPRENWARVLNLNHTDGAIGMHGDFFLGQIGENKFKLVTSDYLEEASLNIAYSVRFSMLVGGKRKYCLIDPLIKTSSDYDP